MGTRDQETVKQEPRVMHDPPVTRDGPARGLAKIGKTGDVLEAWTNQLDALIVSNLAAGAQANDAYRVRIDGLRTRLHAVQGKFDEFNDPQGNGGTFETFRAAVAEDWAILESAMEELKR